ncbi:hypothetical protein [Streptomyces sp. RerS4]|uniref:hypothetical protein n=1 Tax=Streptomyces sp. RerS4 TaxID=2942449 RepID=UPI00201B99DA|nr:hypothetical protein [Streptomyces sp. RerS4]UQW99746.1 hypothetical protein M4D82_03730 [Streptomyces sp. RerS4]
MTRPVSRDLDSCADRLAEGRLPRAAGEIIAGGGFLTQRGLAVGDGVTLELNGRRVSGTVVGELIDSDSRALATSWETLTRLSPETRAIEYAVRLAPGSDARAYADAVEALDPGLRARPTGWSSAPTVTVVGFATVFTILLTTVASLGVFNTVMLNIRERRRDLGMLSRSA